MRSPNHIASRLAVALPTKGIAARKRKPGSRAPPRETCGVLAKYASHVTSASEGAVTDKNP